MTEDKALEILKKAILLERRGNAFYQKVSEQAENDAVKTFFKHMAEEEAKHSATLAAQFKSYTENKRFISSDYHDSKSEVASKILTEELKGRISAAGFEAAAISAAMSMEEQAIQLYTERAQAAADPQEKALYEWLSDWEKEHLDYLSKIDRELTEGIWFDSQFWPF